MTAPARQAHRLEVGCLEKQHPARLANTRIPRTLWTTRHECTLSMQTRAGKASMTDTNHNPWPDAAPGTVAVSGAGAAPLPQLINMHGHQIRSDEPVKSGGTDTGPDPYDLLLAALGSCTAMTVRLYAAQKQWPLTNVHVTLKHQKIYAQDCAECETKEGRIDQIDRVIRLEGALDDAQRKRLMEIADKCPVHRTLHSEVRIVTREDT